MRATITRTVPILDSPRVAQIRGQFDLAAEPASSVSWEVNLPIEEKPWQIGLIVGPSGCGKSTLARELWPTQLKNSSMLAWNDTATILDAFPEAMSVKDVTALLCSVGFSSPPSWLRPFHVLSTGQQFRVTLARLLAGALDHQAKTEEFATRHSRIMGEKYSACPSTPIIFDEFTSVVDRTVAQIGSAALAKTVRTRNAPGVPGSGIHAPGMQFIAVTCHEDVQDWLQPDWVYRPAEGTFLWRSLQRHPPIQLRIFRCHSSAWALFAPHHYLSHSLNPSAVCFMAVWSGRPVAFSAWLPYVGQGQKGRREHRTVCLPDYQGVGIGNAVSDTIASMWKGLGYRALSTTTHPAMIRSRHASPNWRMSRAPSFAGQSEGSLKHATTRLTAGFQYIGPAMAEGQARALLGK